MSSTPQDQYLAVCKELERLRHDIARHVEIAATQAQELEELRAELAAARALLREAYVAMREPTGEWHDIKCNTVLPKIHAALAEGKK